MKGYHLNTLIYIFSHRSTLYWFVSMFCHLVDPLCNYHGYDQFMSWNYISTLYIWWLYPSVNMIMDPQCILWWPYLESPLPLKHRYACLGFETCHNVFLMVICNFYQVLRIHTLALNICKVFWPSFSLLTSHFRGHSVTHEIFTRRYLTLSVVKCHISVSYTLTPWNNLCHYP
jgi:hypothetical protein